MTTLADSLLRFRHHDDDDAAAVVEHVADSSVAGDRTVESVAMKWLGGTARHDRYSAGIGTYPALQTTFAVPTRSSASTADLVR